ncbi:MAG: hypothetical protein ACI9K2_006283, partial [Myxococcota bacterium]
MASGTPWRRRLLRLAAVTVGLLGGAVALAVLVLAVVVVFLTTPWGHQVLQEQAIERVNGLLVDGEFSVGALRTDVLSFVEIDDAALVTTAGDPIVQIGQLAVRYDLTPLLSKQVLITTVELNGARVDLRTDDAGNLELL